MTTGCRRGVRMAAMAAVVPAAGAVAPLGFTRDGLIKDVRRPWSR